MMAVLKPWDSTPGGCEFDVKSPRLGCLVEMPLPSRLLKFRAVFCAQAMTELTMGTTESTTRGLVDACRVIDDAFADEDLLELDSSAAGLIHECTSASTALRALATRTFTEAADEAVMLIVGRRGKTDKSVQTSIANAVLADSFLSATSDLYVKGRATILEVGAKLAAHEAELVEREWVPDEAAFEVLRGMLKDLARARTSPAASLFDRFADALAYRVAQVWRAFETKRKGGGEAPSATLVRTLEGFAMEAAVAYSLDDAMLAMQSTVLQIGKESRADAQRGALLDMVSDGWAIALDGDDFEAQANKVVDALDRHEGLAPTDEVRVRLKAFAAQLADIVADGLIDGALDRLTLGTDLLSKAVAFASLDDTRAEVEKLVRATIDLRRCMASAERTAEDDDDARRDAIHEVTVANMKVAKAKTDFDKVVSETTVGDTIEEAVAAIVGQSDEMVTSFGGLLMDRRRESFTAAATTVEGLCGGLLAGKAWHVGVHGSGEAAWQELQTVAQDTILKVDTKKLEVALQEMMTKLESFVSAATLMDLTATEKGFIDDAHAKHRDASVLVHQAVLVEHLSKETDREVLRRRVQNEVRALRALGCQEKAVLPAALYKRSYSALACLL